MLNNLKYVLTKTWYNPRYLGYYWQNAYFFRGHFPAIFKYFDSFKKPKGLDIGEISGLKNVHVILRTTNSVMNINAPRNLDDIGIITRNDVIRVGGCSIFKAGAKFAEKYGKENIRITFVVDKLSEEGMAQYQKVADDVGLSFDVVEAKAHGNGPSFQTQIDIALQDTDETLAFIVEDDYMLDGEAIATCFQIMKDHSKIVGMNPHFHPDRVRRQDIGKLITLDGKLYCQIFNTCCTFFMPVSQIRRYKKYLQTYDGWEDGSVNSVWKRSVCLSPLGWTMAEHLHRTELSPVTELVNI